MLPPEGPLRSPARRTVLYRERGSRLLRADAVALLIAWFGLALVFTVLSPLFLSVQNLLNIGRAVAVTGIVASGTTIALVSGALDLSIASVMNLAGVVAGGLSIAGVPAPLAILAGVACGTAVGIANGFVVTRLRINPIIATLASAGIVSGISYLLTSGVESALSDPLFQSIGRSQVAGLPTSMILFAIVVGITFVILRYTHFGRMTYAIGGNPIACALAGINVNRWRMLFFTASSFSASLAGIVLLSKLGTVIPNAATGTELTTIAAVILGGTSLAGGAGSIQGTVVGVAILGTLTNGLGLLNVDAYWQAIISGVVLIVAVAADRLRTGGYR
jgi:ribose transport system permease protein